MSHFGILSAFDHNTSTWSTYKSRISQWFIANDIDTTEQSAKCRAILLSALADGTYKLAANLAFPRDLQDLPYGDIVNILDTHFTQKRAGFTNRHKFYSATQRQDESYQQWALRLRGLAEHCGFNDVEEALRDRFVMGSALGPARDKLYEQDIEKMTLEDAVLMADNVRCARDASTAGNNSWFMNKGMPSTFGSPAAPTLPVSGYKPAPSGLFGAPLAFGTTSAQPATGGGMSFGSSAAPKPPPPGGFTSTTGSSASPFGFRPSFGSRTAQPAASGGTQEETKSQLK